MTKFKLWRDGLVLAAVMLGAGFWMLSDIGFGGDWTLESHDSVAVSPDVLHLHISSGKHPRLRLRTACDRYEPGYSRWFGGLSVRPIVTSRRCPNDQGLMASLSAAQRYTFGDERLILTAADGRTLVFRRDPLL